MIIIIIFCILAVLFRREGQSTLQALTRPTSRSLWICRWRTVWVCCVRTEKNGDESVKWTHSRMQVGAAPRLYLGSSPGIPTVPWWGSGRHLQPLATTFCPTCNRVRLTQPPEKMCVRWRRMGRGRGVRSNLVSHPGHMPWDVLI